MARPESENGSAIPVWKGKPQKRTGKRKGIVIIIIIAVTFILAGVVVASLIYSKSKDVENIWLDYYSDVVNGFNLLLWSMEGFGFYLFKSNVLKVEKPEIGAGTTVVIFYISLFAIALSGWMKIQSEVTKPPELVSIVDLGVDGKLGEGEDEKENEIPPSGLKYQKKQYLFSEDPFVEELSAYYGVEKNSIPEEEVIDKKANLIYEDMKMIAETKEYNNIPKESDSALPEEYEWNTNLAKLQYETYKAERERDWNAVSDFAERQEWRLNDLSSCKTYRQAANTFYRDSSNIKDIALYWLDEGDEYARCAEMVKDETRQIKEREKMYKAYWECAEKCMDAIYAAAEKGDKKCMEDALDAFRKVSIAAKDDSSITEMYQVYKKVVEKWEKIL